MYIWISGLTNLSYLIGLVVVNNWSLWSHMIFSVLLQSLIVFFQIFSLVNTTFLRSIVAWNLWIAQFLILLIRDYFSTWLLYEHDWNYVKLYIIIPVPVPWSTKTIVSPVLDKLYNPTYQTCWISLFFFVEALFLKNNCLFS